MYTKEAKEMLTWCKRQGWEPTGYRGSGHIGLRHTSGVEAVISATPSDSRSRKNERATLMRLTDQREDKPNAAHYSKKRSRGGYASTYARPADENSPWVVAAAELEAVDAELRECRPRSKRALDLARMRLSLEEELRSHYQPVPPCPKVF